MMATAVGISASSLQRIWRAPRLQPYRVQQFKLSNDPKFIDKLRDVVRLCVDPPAQAAPGNRKFLAGPSPNCRIGPTRI